MSKDSYQNLILLGHGLKTHGLHGAIHAQFINPQGEVLKKNLVIQYKSQNAKAKTKKIFPLTIKTLSHGKTSRVEFFEWTCIEQAQENLPGEIYVFRSQLPELQEDEVYWEDLLGMKVFGPHQDIASQGHLGTVKDYYSNGVQLILIIEIDAKTLWEIPYVKEHFPETSLSFRYLRCAHQDWSV